ncbi:copper chaperone PCu(A)C [Jannaschia rubra]|uniref:copper chaperone PCu(A)C n=1 Tax=Jannaschia rubra TaxID=282197 RepID=UPI0024925397|nr:copper chaperone PCu(A)C [Jannaschia rubra]
MRIFPILAALTLAVALPAGAQTTTLGDLTLDAPMLRDTPPNAPVAGGFLTVTNNGEADDTLISAATIDGIAGEVQLHRMEMVGDVMKMAQVDGGIEIPAGATVTLMPGGLHLMLMGLTGPLEAGTSHPVTLIFENAGEVTMDFPVMTLAEIRAATGEAGMDAGKMGN